MAEHKDYARLRSDYSTNTVLTIVRTEDGDVCLKVSGDGEMRIAMSGSRLQPEDRLRVLEAFQNLIDVIPVMNTCGECYWYSDITVHICEHEKEPTTESQEACPLFEPKEET